MTKPRSRHLLEMLAEIPDFREAQGKRDPLSAILGLTVWAMLWVIVVTALSHMGRTYHSALVRALGFTHKKHLVPQRYPISKT